jgi:hypothetical protein
LEKRPQAEEEGKAEGREAQRLQQPEREPRARDTEFIVNRLAGRAEAARVGRVVRDEAGGGDDGRDGQKQAEGLAAVLETTTLLFFVGVFFHRYIASQM